MQFHLFADWQNEQDIPGCFNSAAKITKTCESAPKNNDQGDFWI